MATSPARRLTAGSGAAAANKEIADSLGELFVRVRDHFERAVQPYDLPPYCAKALTLIDSPFSMKELAARVHCDGSFVTSIADTLEERGLVRREIDARDRRVKNLVLTAEGGELRARLMADLFGDFPGLRILDAGERIALLGLLRKMVAGETGSATDPGCAGSGRTPPAAR